MAYSSMVSSSEAAKMIYSGESDPVEWFKIFEVQAACNDWEDDEKLKFIMAFLDSKAKRLIEAAQSGDIDTYEKIKAMVIKGCAKSTDSLTTSFLNEKRRATEPLSKYARRLQEMLLKALPTLGPAERTTLLRNQLCSAVPDNLKALIQFSSSFGDNNWDKILDMLDRSNPTATATSSFNLIKNTDSLDINNTYLSNNNGNRGQRNGPRPPQNYGSGSVVCYTCNAAGHKSMHCPRRYSNQNNNYRSNASHSNNAGNFRPPQNFHSGQQRPQHQQFGFMQHNQSRMPNRINVHANSSNEYQNEFQTDMYSNATGLADLSFPFYGNYSNLVENNNINNNTAVDGADNKNMYSHVIDMEVSVLKVNASCENQNLLKVKVLLNLFGLKTEIVAKALVDGGSSHSFISPDILSYAHKKILMDPNSLWVRKSMHRINGVVAGTDSMCSMVTGDISLHSASGETLTFEQEFVISSAVRNYDMIIGRSFLKPNNVSVSHGSDSIIFPNENEEVNSIDAQINSISFKKVDENSSGSDLSDKHLETDAKEKVINLEKQILDLQVLLSKTNVSEQQSSLIQLDVLRNEKASL
jgi:hypothetical protein